MDNTKLEHIKNSGAKTALTHALNGYLQKAVELINSANAGSFDQKLDAALANIEDARAVKVELDKF